MRGPFCNVYLKVCWPEKRRKEEEEVYEYMYGTQGKLGKSSKQQKWEGRGRREREIEGGK